LDKGLPFKVKYGGEKGWKLSLRYNENTREPLEWKEDVGGFTSGIAARCKDDRFKPIEVVRPCIELCNPLPNLEIKLGER
jgi:hypothetical protein